jgi:hypothetical protein
MAAKSKQKIPKVLEERLLIDEQQREILKTMVELSPSDTGYLYLPGVNGFRMPTLDQIAKEVNKTPEEVRKNIEKTKNVWKLPEKLPTGGILNDEEALVYALVNQEKLRWDENIGDYRVPMIHGFTSELGLGTLIARDEALKGEAMLRKALGLDEKLNSYNIQGGVMPPVMTMYGSLKAEQASLVGLNKTGKEVDQEEVEKLKKYFDAALSELAKGKEDVFSTVDEKTLKNMETYVVNTIDSQEEAARSVAYELAPLFENIPSEVPIHIHWSYNDDYNLKELGDVLIAKMRMVRDQASKAKKKLPKLKEELSERKTKVSQAFLNSTIADYVTSHFEDAVEAGAFDITDEKTEEVERKIPKGKKFRKYIQENFLTDDDQERLKKKLLKSFKSNYGRETGIDKALDNAISRYAHAQQISSLEDVAERKRVDDNNKEKNETKIPNLEDVITENQRYIEALAAEEQEGHAWFTKKVAMTPTETKAQRMIAKQYYKSLYEDILFPEIEKIIGRELNILLHTDREISTLIEDPAKIYGMNDFDDDLVTGTIITSIPRTNRQMSDEPNLNSYAILQGKHASAVSERVKAGKGRPKKLKDFDKHHGLAYSDVTWTSWGAEGFLVQPKTVIAPTRIEGEYRTTPEIVHHLKTPTRHNTAILGELAKKGNKGTKEVKRVEKGGGTTGDVYLFRHPDRSSEWLFADDQFYEMIEEKFGYKQNYLEQKLERAKSKEKKQFWQTELDKINGAIVEEAKLYNMLLENDVHLGNPNMAGRPNNVDVFRGAFIPALQSIGFENIQAIQGSEFLDGNQAWRAFNSSYQGEHEHQQAQHEKEWMLQQGLREYFTRQGMKGPKLEKRIAQHMEDFRHEQDFVRPTFRTNDQLRMYKDIVKPLNDEALKSGAPFYVASGNHFASSVRGTQDEAALITDTHPAKLRKTGQIKQMSSYGNDATYRPTRLPGDQLSGERYEGIPAVIAHKMWHGNTEISKLSTQAVGTKENAQIFITSDRHHPGMFAERGKYGILDVGKATVVDYVQKIGKASSVRGAAILGYSPHGNNIFSGRFYLDDVVDTIISWPEKAERMAINQQVIQNEMKKAYSK